MADLWINIAIIFGGIGGGLSVFVPIVMYIVKRQFRSQELKAMNYNALRDKLLVLEGELAGIKEMQHGKNEALSNSIEEIKKHISELNETFKEHLNYHLEAKK